tara:strand:- start:153 stop:332 length:180 start_codon:yes stop_codon:yes gene_type:complete
MARKIPDEITNQLYKALNKLEISNDIIQSLVDYYDIPENELTEGERCLLKRSKEYLGIE